jgi:SnoaL-like protein
MVLTSDEALLAHSIVLDFTNDASSMTDQTPGSTPMPRMKLSLITAGIVIASIAMMMAFTQDQDDADGTHQHATNTAQDGQTTLSGLALARSYISGMEDGDLDALSALFIADNKSSILENASDEGSWEHYRDHHLKPEMDVVKNFKFEIAKESERVYGPVTLVQQTGTFSVDVRGETLKYRVAVSYTIVMQDDKPRIAHLHWSSRPEKKQAPTPPAQHKPE